MSPSPTTEGQLPLEENRRIFREQIAPVFLEGSAPQRTPVAVIVAGQTGAGKTAVTRMVKEALEGNGPAAWINMDFYNPHSPRRRRRLAYQTVMPALVNELRDGPLLLQDQHGASRTASIFRRKS